MKKLVSLILVICLMASVAFACPCTGTSQACEINHIYVITVMNAAKCDVHLRQAPDVRAKSYGLVPYGEVLVSERCYYNSGDYWYEVNWQNTIGWICATNSLIKVVAREDVEAEVCLARKNAPIRFTFDFDFGSSSGSHSSSTSTPASCQHTKATTTVVKWPNNCWDQIVMRIDCPDCGYSKQYNDGTVAHSWTGEVRESNGYKYTYCSFGCGQYHMTKIVTMVGNGGCNKHSGGCCDCEK